MVVCPTSDLFHREVPDEFIRDAYDYMAAYCGHTFIVPTKRPGRLASSFISSIPLNVWHLVSAENQEAADERIPELLKLRTRPNLVLGVSIEPMLGPVDLTAMNTLRDLAPLLRYDALRGQSRCGPQMFETNSEGVALPKGKLDWVIVGCESGPNRRPFDESWARSVRDQCVAAGVPYYYKQGIVNGKLVHMPELDGRVWDQTPPTGG